MFKYTLCFIVRNDEVLMLNRNKSPWMGCWNGVGGKLEQGENAIDCVVREIEEETIVKTSELTIVPKGIVTWNNEFFGEENGLYLFVATLKRDFCSNYPYKTRDGIMDIKKIDWVSSKENLGVSRNIPYFLPTALTNSSLFEYHCTFNGDELKSVVTKSIDLEWLEQEIRKSYTVKS